MAPATAAGRAARAPPSRHDNNDTFDIDGKYVSNSSEQKMNACRGSKSKEKKKSHKHQLDLNNDTVNKVASGGNDWFTGSWRAQLVTCVDSLWHFNSLVL